MAENICRAYKLGKLKWVCFDIATCKIYCRQVSLNMVSKNGHGKHWIRCLEFIYLSRTLWIPMANELCDQNVPASAWRFCLWSTYFRSHPSLTAQNWPGQFEQQLEEWSIIQTHFGQMTFYNLYLFPFEEYFVWRNWEYTRFCQEILQIESPLLSTIDRSEEEKLQRTCFVLSNNSRKMQNKSLLKQWKSFPNSFLGKALPLKAQNTLKIHTNISLFAMQFPRITKKSSWNTIP